MKRSLIILAIMAFSVVSCGTIGQYSDAGRFQDGIYYRPQRVADVYTPLTQEEIETIAALEIQSKLYADSLNLALEPEEEYYDPYFNWRPYSWYGPYSRYGWGGYYGGWYGWHRPYSWYGPYSYYYGPYSWYDPFWDPYWDPFWDPYWYGPAYPHHHPGYIGGGNFQYASHPGRTMSSSGIVSRGASSLGGNARTVRQATADATRDMNTLRRAASTSRSTALNRPAVTPSVGNRNMAATRAGNNASNVRTMDRSHNEYRSNDSYRSSGSSSFSGGSSHSGGGMSHSSSGGGGMSHGGGGHR